MTERWLRISIPIQALLLLNQVVTGLNVDRIPDRIYIIVHLGGGLLFTALVAVHVAVNWDWVRKYWRK